MGRVSTDPDVSVKNYRIGMVIRVIEVDNVIGRSGIEPYRRGVVDVGTVPAEFDSRAEMVPAVIHLDGTVVQIDCFAFTFDLAEREVAVGSEGICCSTERSGLSVVHRQVPTVLGRRNRDGAVGRRNDTAHRAARRRMDVVSAHQEGAVAVVDVDIVCVAVVGQYDIAAEAVKGYLERMESAVEIAGTVVTVTRTVVIDFQISGTGFTGGINNLKFWR